jgi:hypothetical protein
LAKREAGDAIKIAEGLRCLADPGFDPLSGAIGRRRREDADYTQDVLGEIVRRDQQKPSLTISEMIRLIGRVIEQTNLTERQNGKEPFRIHSSSP